MTKMGSVKDLVMDDSAAGKLYIPTLMGGFGQGVWKVSGRFSVKDLKKLIPAVEIPQKAEMLTMTTAAFFEWMAGKHPEIETCYLGVLDKDGEITDTSTLLQKGDTSTHIVMKLADTPDTLFAGNVEMYEDALKARKVQCGVADVESIYRKGFPLGSSTFKGIFKAVGKGDVYDKLATYDDTVAALDDIREMVKGREKDFPDLEAALAAAKLDRIPNPGFMLRDIAYDSTTKFEKGGDRKIGKEEEKELSGLSDEGYETWTENWFPRIARAQIEYCDARGIMNMDGKAECVTYNGMPVVTDFLCTPDENRLMIAVEIDGITWAIPSNKEVQRAEFKSAGVDVAITEAKEMAEKAGDPGKWLDYVTERCKAHKIDLQDVTDRSCALMASAIGEVGNRMLGKKVFDAQPVDTWAEEFIPYASRIERQG
jgi:phosphoribosylaminoimidazole-succinocarboxamide synthase